MMLGQIHDWDIFHHICRRCGETSIDRIEGRGTEFCDAPPNMVSLEYLRMKKLSDELVGKVVAHFDRR